MTSVRYRQVARQEARMSAAVNGWFLCDRGRFGFFYTSRADRPRQAAIKGETAGMEEALAHARSRLEALAPAGVAVIGSPRSTLEVLVLTEWAARLRGWLGPAFFADATASRPVKAAVSRLEAGLAVSMGEIDQADFILVVGVDPLNEAPMLALALRQAAQKGAGVWVVDPRPVSLPFEFTHIPTAPRALGALLGRVLKKSVEPIGLDGPAAQFYASLPDRPASDPELEARVAELLAASRRPIIVCGTGIVASECVELAADAALLLTAAQKKAGLFYVLAEANAFAAGLLAQPDSTTERILKAAAEGHIQALVLVENDPFATFPDRRLLEQALARIECLIVLDYLDTPVSRMAHVFLPTQTLYESGGIYINQEGRVQFSAAAFAGGTPVRETGGRDHPPRVYGSGLPGADPQPAGRLVARLAGEEIPVDLSAQSEYFNMQISQLLSGLPDPEQLPPDGLRLPLENHSPDRFKPAQPPAPAAEPDDLEIILTERTFGTEELSTYSACLETLEGEPFAGLSRQDAEDLGIRDGDRIAIRTENGAVERVARVWESMAAGVVIIPRLRKLPWQGLGKNIRRQDIRKA
jgi:NADH-quinone oxidoreductase subunit G